MRLTAIAVILFLVCAHNATSLTGTVQNGSGEPIEGARVTCTVLDTSVFSGEDGTFSLEVAVGIRPSDRSLSHAGMWLRGGNLLVSLPRAQQVRLSLTDLAGRQRVLFEGRLESGTHALGGAQVSSDGVYLLHAVIGGERLTRSTVTLGKERSLGRAASRVGAQGGAVGKELVEVVDTVLISKAGYVGDTIAIAGYDADLGVITLQDALSYADSVTDIDGNVYHTVQIGNQEWTVENLRVTRYNDGTPIPHVTDGDQWGDLTTPGYCFYDNGTDSAANAKWGALYNWYAVNTGMLAPSGWHVPTDAEWDTLENYLIVNGFNWDGTTSLNKIGKALAAQTDWRSSTTTGEVGNELASNNTAGFSALPSGYRYFRGGSFNYQSEYAYWWSATENGTSAAWYRYLNYTEEFLSSSDNHKTFGFAVRLLRD